MEQSRLGQFYPVRVQIEVEWMGDSPGDAKRRLYEALKAAGFISELPKCVAMERYKWTPEE